MLENTTESEGSGFRRKWLSRAAVGAVVVAAALAVVFFFGANSSDIKHIKFSGLSAADTLRRGPQGVRVTLAVIGGGIGGLHTAFRASKVLGSQVALLEAGNSPCGIIQDAELVGSTTANPLRMGGCAVRINLASMVPMRNLANEMGVPLYYLQSFKNQYQMLGRDGDSSAAISSGWNLPPIPFGEDPSDPELSALLYLLGSAQGNGVDVNPLTGNDDYANGTHPTQQCGKFKDLYSMYRAYFGDAYANFICSVNVGFLGDCYIGQDPCAYLDWYQREWNTAGNGYPVGGLTEVCRRLKQNATTNGALFFYEEPVISINTLGNGKFAISTSKQRIVADDLVLNLSPSELAAISGDVTSAILARPEASQPQKVATVTVAAQFDSAWWIDAGIVEASSLSSYRLLQIGGCLTRLEIHNSPYQQLHKTVRLVYTDYQCIDIWRQFVRLGESTLRDELMRSLRNAFPLATIPNPIKIFSDVQPQAWWWLRPGAEFTWQQVQAWALAPLGPSKRVCLANHAYRVKDAGWSVAAVRLSSYCLQRFYPRSFTAQTIQDWETAYGRITPGFGGEVDIPSPLANEIFSWDTNSAVVWSVPPFSYLSGPAGPRTRSAINQRKRPDR